MHWSYHIPTGIMATLSFILQVIVLVAAVSARQITFHNKCGKTIWVSPLTNAQGPVLGGGVQQVNAGGQHVYQIPDSGWAGRFWPKTGCGANGQNCEMGQSDPPCPSGGCQPPADTKVEFNFPPLNNGAEVWYDVSLVDGYSLAAKIEPSVQQGTCKTTSCAVALGSCPTNENNVGDLRVIKNGQTVQCLSPCKKWNYPPPYGQGHPENQDPGLHFCCPTPPISPEQCRGGPVINTKYVSLIHKQCPTAYSYAYDDEGGLHNCPNNVSFQVTFCP